VTAQAGPTAGMGFHATHLTVPAQIAGTDPPRPAGIGQPRDVAPETARSRPGLPIEPHRRGNTRGNPNKSDEKGGDRFAPQVRRDIRLFGAGWPEPGWGTPVGLCKGVLIR
jgi:hypothetical protein